MGGRRGGGLELGIKVTSPVLAVTLPPPNTAPVLHDRTLLTHLLKQRALLRCVFVVGYSRFFIGASHLPVTVTLKLSVVSSTNTISRSFSNINDHLFIEII